MDLPHYMNYVDTVSDTTDLEKILQTLQYHVLYINLPTKAGSGVHSMPSMPSFRTFFSGPAQVGQKVFAIGNPFGLDQTLTNGIISDSAKESKEAGRAFVGSKLESKGPLRLFKDL